MQPQPLKIAVTGPESTGKSALCEALARHYDTVWVPEFARTHLVDQAPPYTRETLDYIADGQTAAEQEAEPHAYRLLFCDTEMTVMKVWSEHAFGHCTPHIQDLYNRQSYDLYLLADIDLPWEPDPLREHPHLRSHFFEKYREALSEAGRPFKVISGLGIQRLHNAILEIEKLGFEPVV